MINRNAPKGPAQYTGLVLFIHYFLVVLLLVWLLSS
jgi:hypothetical protein